MRLRGGEEVFGDAETDAWCWVVLVWALMVMGNWIGGLPREAPVTMRVLDISGVL